MKIKCTFLNAPLKETIYLEISQGLNLEKRKYCLRLSQEIYGLQAEPLAWYEQLKRWITLVNLSVCILDPCIFHSSGKIPTWLYVHVDNIAIFSNNVEGFKKGIGKEFEIKDIGPANPTLGVKIYQMKDGISLNQQHFTESLVEQYRMNTCRVVATPLTPNEHLCPATTDAVILFKKLKTNYRSTIGSINYLSTATQPDLSFAVSTLSQYLETPGLKHWKAFLHVVKYLGGSQNRGLYYPRQARKTVTAFIDADWGNFQVTSCLNTGYLTCFHQFLVFWKTCKQPSTFIAEAEYNSLCELTSEFIWFKQWCEEARLLMLEDPTLIYEDN
ncbi:hypothetical protein O181_105215 [Austropuccinia psidii MF-1]|uniref:Reverse transcriptase Ty1/copia-type domain-containing protein n=1 Tax=Austropuccinia psidii MF-1 TaxID=1389203 RepID=A0A9Q3JL93_9BASI|nr:hypothetical protein [Austropuccinia psidii MF-1]